MTWYDNERDIKMSSRWFQYYSYAWLLSCLHALPTSTPTTSPQPSSPWQYTEMCWTGMTHHSQLSTGYYWISCTHEDGYPVQEAYMHRNNEDTEKGQTYNQIYLWLLVQRVAYATCYTVLPQTWQYDPLPWLEAILIVLTDAVDVAACHISLVWAVSSCLTLLHSARGGLIDVLLARDQLSSIYCEHLLG